MRKQVEALEDDADLAAQAVHIDARPGDAIAFELDLAALDRLETVDAAQQGGLAAAGRTDQAHHLMLVDRHVDAAQNIQRPEALMDVMDFKKGHISSLLACAPDPARAGDRQSGPAEW
jgi:hypothetical protein